LTRKDWQLFLEENLLTAPAFLFSNDTMSVRINYTRLSDAQLSIFQTSLLRITEKIRKDAVYE
jgi:hypothetical protein